MQWYRTRTLHVVFFFMSCEFMQAAVNWSLVLPAKAASLNEVHFVVIY